MRNVRCEITSHITHHTFHIYKKPFGVSFSGAFFVVFEKGICHNYIPTKKVGNIDLMAIK
jgi:hypothetical protein